LSTAVVRQASTDAYAAREALGSRTLCASITPHDERRLADVVASSGLGQGFIAAELLDNLTASVQTADDKLRILLHSSGTRTSVSTDL
jgi:hypothetical protein